ncbi:hypothetical protein CCMSSC00406_0009513 [Pleurotus cornucopiae]|uniref:Uncharacterized protein n=1 Tax=Pleurotus cornucopiae TaxID=5321 RepID=A0ACB7IPN3_PLECO|nr:hypothetical protein CCMSSC00406_0009513 [Pleurotus cornucopiae]
MPYNSTPMGSPAMAAQGFKVPDPFAPRRRPAAASFVNALLATALLRCWHILLFYGFWATAVTVVSHNWYDLSIKPIMLTATGTILGFVVSYRTTSSFERYNEGRRLWAQIIHASRVFARSIWFHVPDDAAKTTLTAHLTPETLKARTIIEKKSALNLLEAFSVAIKHYLRGEDGIYYEDLYHLVKFLPEYALPAGIPRRPDMASPVVRPMSAEPGDRSSPDMDYFSPRPMTITITSASETDLPLPTTTRGPVPDYGRSPGGHLNPHPPPYPMFRRRSTVRSTMLNRKDEAYLLPASLPPRCQIFDIFPFSLIVKRLTKNGLALEGKKAAKVRTLMKNKTISHNIPLEISLYLGSYVSALQARKCLDVPTQNVLLLSLNQLVDALTGLERVLTTPIPFSYSFHLWAVTVIFCLALPFQIWASLQWMTIPATVIASFFFFGFLVAGEEIENPFGYDKNDLNLDHFTHNIIRNEMHAITSTPAPDPSLWAFSPHNDLLFAVRVDDKVERLTPDQWVRRGPMRMQEAMADI